MDFEWLIAALNDYIIVASVIVIMIRNSINCAALIYICYWIIILKKWQSNLWFYVDLQSETKL